MFYLFTMNWLFSMIFIFLNHPISLGCILLIQTIIITMLTGLLMNNFWFSYILFLIMIGGMMIMFIYMTSVASNEKFKMPKMMIMVSSLSMMLLLFTLLYLFDNFYAIQSKYPMFSATNPIFFKFILNKLYSMPNIFMMMILIIYLLLTLIVVTKIIETKFGTLRQK